jgi:hypothetical protein
MLGTQSLNRILRNPENVDCELIKIACRAQPGAEAGEAFTSHSVQRCFGEYAARRVPV